MADVDAILASGRYVDRLGAVWSYIGLAGLWVLWDDAGNGRLTPGQMRLKIERDLHRDECPGLKLCYRHPVPRVVRVGRAGGRVFAIYGSPDGQAQPDEDTLADAITAALTSHQHPTPPGSSGKCNHEARGVTWAEGDTTCYVCETCAHEWTETR